MQVFNSAERYGAVTQTLHWLTVVLVALGWLLGQFGEALPSKAAEQTALFVHMTAGTLVIALVVLRLAWRLADAPPPPDVAQGGWLDKAAKVTHVVLYVLLFAAPVAGIVLQFARGRAVPLFGLGEIASPWPADRTFSRSVKEVHEVLANALVIAAVLHAAAALAHHWVWRDRTLKRMLPGVGR
jgi:cytochrome b561